MIMKTSFAVVFRAAFASALLFAPVSLRADAKPGYLDGGKPPDARAEDLLGRLTLEEKVALCHGDSYWSNPGVPRLGVPKLVLSDGPHGVHEERLEHGWKTAGRSDDFVTDLPAGMGLAATWNAGLAQRYGEVLGAEARARGKGVILGPGVNIARTPLFGRNFEFFGEDPYLAARITVPYIRGVQSQGVAASVKHFAVNNQEIGAREGIDAVVGERALHEIYLPAFKAAVQEAGVLTVMGAYNSVNGEQACESDTLLNRILKKEWGFRGLVVSDWGGAHTTMGAALGGLDLEMSGWPGREYDGMHLGRAFREAVRDGRIPEAVLDDKVRRILRVMISIGLLDAADGTRPAGAMNTPAHQAVARQVAEEGIVLLKNEGGLLPLDLKKISRVAVIGGNAGKKHSPAGGGLPGGGSSAVKPLHEITPVEGLLARLGAQGVTVTHAPGYSADAAGAEGVSKLVGASGETSITGEGGAAGATSAVGAAGAAGAVDAAGAVSAAGAAGAAGAVSAAVLRERAVAAAKAADAVIYAGGFDHSVETEMKDRVDMSLPHGQVELIRALVAANPRTVVVLIGGSAMEMDAWVRDARAVLFAPYGGSEGGAALARILSGDANPSGKLPVTLARRLEDYAPHADGDSTSYPGTKERVWYREGIFTGYRFFDARGIEPLFCFGHGLSYTQFRHDDMRVGRIGGEGAFNVSFRLTNTGVHAGAEVAQVYVSQKNPRIERPVRELKGFAKVFLKPGESRDVTITLKADAFAYYDAGKSAWVTPACEYVVAVGSSSRDIRLEAPVALE